MGLDSVYLIVVSVALLLGFLSLVLGKSFIQRRDSLNAVDTLWYVTLVLVVCLGFSVYVLLRHNSDVHDELERLEQKLDNYQAPG
jgi:hypothetical protein